MTEVSGYTAGGASSAHDHPAHYGGADNPYEAIKVIEAWGLGFNLGNAVKYISRAGKKDEGKLVEDLKKAGWYVRRETMRLTGVAEPTRDQEIEALMFSLQNIGNMMEGVDCSYIARQLHDEGYRQDVLAVGHAPNKPTSRLAFADREREEAMDRLKARHADDPIISEVLARNKADREHTPEYVGDPEVVDPEVVEVVEATALPNAR